MSYHGCAPDWKPDLVLASRANDAVSVEEQIAREKRRYAQELAESPPDASEEVPEPSEEDDDDD